MGTHIGSPASEQIQVGVTTPVPLSRDNNSRPRQTSAAFCDDNLKKREGDGCSQFHIRLAAKSRRS